MKIKARVFVSILTRYVKTREILMLLHLFTKQIYACVYWVFVNLCLQWLHGY